MAAASVSGKTSPVGENYQACQLASVWKGHTVERLFGSTGSLAVKPGNEEADPPSIQDLKHQAVLNPPSKMKAMVWKYLPQQQPKHGVDQDLYATHPLPIVALGEKWSFCPSDHLPVGIQLGNVDFISWNVLHSDHVQPWVVEKNTQGLQGSIITQLQMLLQEKGRLISKREKEIARLVCDMLTFTRCSNRCIALQECSDQFLDYLNGQLPVGYELLSSKTHSGCAVIYDKMKMKVNKYEEVVVSQETRSKPVMDIVFARRTDNKQFRVINVHVTGDPRSSYKQDLMGYTMRVLSENPYSLILCGDMNFTTEEMGMGLTEFQKERVQFCTPYRSNVGPIFGQEGLHAKLIDYFIIRQRDEARLLKPEEIFSGKNSDVITKTLKLFVDPANAAPKT